MRYFVSIDGAETVVDVAELPGGTFDVKVLSGPDASAPGRSVRTTPLGGSAQSALGVDGKVFDLVLEGEMPRLEVFASGRRASVAVETARMRAAASVRGVGAGGSAGILKSPMPGKVVKLLVSEGMEVTAGTPLVVVEAMKMENELVAEAAGTVKKVFVSAGDAVEGGARLILIA
jgi:biotin carboxyl carrier protein